MKLSIIPKKTNSLSIKDHDMEGALYQQTQTVAKLAKGIRPEHVFSEHFSAYGFFPQTCSFVNY